MEIVHETNIGFIYDVCQVIICKTSKRESWINTFILKGCEETDITFIDSTLKQFSDIDRCWNLFTALHPKKGRLITKLFVEFIEKANSTYRGDELAFKMFITDQDMLQQNLTEWYFDCNDTCEGSEYYERLYDMQWMEDILRLSLYEFNTTREKYIARISDSLQLIIEEMKTFYEKNRVKLHTCQEKFEYSKLELKGDLFSPESAWNQHIHVCTVSFSLVNRYILLRDEYELDDYGWLLLGIDFDTEVEALVNSIDLNGFGHALSDITRLNILREIHKNGEKTLTDLSNKFKLVNAVMLYHLDILRKERLLSQRHEGRRVYYWLNYNRLKQAIYTINSEFGGELIETVEETECSSGECCTTE